MPAVDPRTLMWNRACEMIDRAERLHRQFFQPVATSVGELIWQPPIDITETDTEVLITVALPGVEREAVVVTVDADGVFVVGFRRPNAISRGGHVHRLEIPYGRFERRITFPTARLHLGQSAFSDGCLVLMFSK